MAYEQFFGLHEAPFRLTPDPDYFFPSDVHNEALQTLLYSIKAGEGFVQITGEPGTGKTLLLRTILRQLGDEVKTALILNPTLSAQELLRVILEDLGLEYAHMQDRSKEELLRYFRDFLLSRAQQGIKTVVIVDEAQNLPNETMEELRLLSNLETEKEKLLQIILVGQRELERKLALPELRQLNQRITIRFRLKPLTKTDTISYIYHRIRIAGGGEHIRFTHTVLGRIYKLSKGVPRLINIICERALMAAYVAGKNTVEKEQIKKALESIVGEEELRVPAPRLRPATVLLGALLVIVAGSAAGYLFYAPPAEEAVVVKVVPKVDKEALRKEKEALKKREEELAHKEKVLQETHAEVYKKAETLSAHVESLEKKENVLEGQAAVLSEKELELRRKEEELAKKLRELGTKEAVLGEKEKALGQKEATLGEKEKGLAAEEAVRRTREQRTAQSEAPARPETKVAAAPPSVPAAAFDPRRVCGALPEGAFLMAVDCDRGRAMLFKGGASGPVPVRETDCEWSYGEGIFMVGKDGRKGPFVFNHTAFLYGRPYVMPTSLWSQVSDTVSGRAVAVVAYSSRLSGVADPAARSAELKAILANLFETWKRMEVEKLIGFYGDVFTEYDLSVDKPLVVSKAQLYARKKEVLARSGFVAVQTSEPIYLFDPQNPNVAAAVFRQEYRSRIYADVGTKVLYFSRVDEPKGKQSWKIVAKLWLPEE